MEDINEKILCKHENVFTNNYENTASNETHRKYFFSCILNLTVKKMYFINSNGPFRIVYFCAKWGEKKMFPDYITFWIFRTKF